MKTIQYVYMVELTMYQDNFWRAQNFRFGYFSIFELVSFSSVTWLIFYSLKFASKRLINIQVTLRTFPVNPRPAGVWIVTRPAGGGPKGPPPP